MLYCVEKLHRLPSEMGQSSYWELALAIETSARQARREREAMEEARRR